MLNRIQIVDSFQDTKISLKFKHIRISKQATMLLAIISGRIYSKISLEQVMTAQHNFKRKAENKLICEFIDIYHKSVIMDTLPVFERKPETGNGICNADSYCVNLQCCNVHKQ